MNDRILEGYLSTFAKENNLVGMEESTLFEHFINYCIVSRIHPENFEFELVNVGGQNDTGIDGLAILVNEHLINSPEEVDFFKEHLRRLDTSFIFIQAKTSTNFDMGDISKFFFGIQDFFNNVPRLKANEHISRLRQLKEYIYDCAIDMDKSPVCNIYYATTGTWVGDQNLCALVSKEVECLLSSNLFSEVQFIPMDVGTIKSIYKSLKGKVTKVVEFSKHTILPEIDKVEEAYIGILPCAEYLRLISDEDGSIQRSLFYDNVRDFQGNNPVNMEIAASVKDIVQKDKFVLLNNGITIVSKSITKVGAKFTIRDFQIVNGCQTSHVLHRNRHHLSEKLHLPVKLIVTNDPDVTNSIIKATNRQTEVKVEAFEALSPFHKKLEDFYASFDKESDYRLYYERRSKQYEESPINRHRIVSIPGQIKSFLAMFMNEPHSMHRYYGELLMSYKNKIFQENHSLYPYYISSYAWFIIEEMFAKRKLQTLYKPWRYHLLMMFRLLAEKEDLPYLNSKKVEKYCDQLRTVLGDRNIAYSIFETAVKMIDKAMSTATFDNAEARRRKTVTGDLISRISTHMGVSHSKSTGDVTKKYGTVRWFSDTRGYGFIMIHDGPDVFVHYSDIQGYGWKSLEEGQGVEFSILDSPRGPVAKNVVKVYEQFNPVLK